MIEQTEVEERGSEQFDALRVLRRLRDRAFDSSNEQLAVAVGRPAEEIEMLSRCAMPIDEDLLMKARGIARERGIEID